MKGKKRKHRRYFSLLGISLALLTGILLWASLFSSPLRNRLTLEAGDRTLTGKDFLRLGIPGLNYHILTDLTTIDTHVPGDYPVQFLVNGETQVCLLCIRDTKPPVATVQDLTIPVGKALNPEEFLTSLTEETALDLRLYPAKSKKKTAIDVSELAPGSYPLLLVLTDAGGNKSQYPVTVDVCNVRASCQVELGVSDFSVSHYQISDSDQLSYQTDITPLFTQAGTHLIELDINGKTVPVELIVADTTPPKVTTKKLSLWLGETAKPEDFAKKITDASPVSVQFVKKPNYKKIGKQTITLLAEDAFGNETRFKCQLTIKKDKKGPEILGVRDLSFPLGVTITYRKSVFAVDNKDGEVAFQVDSSQVHPNQMGTYPITYFAVDSSGNESSVTAHITITEPLTITEEEVLALADEVLTSLNLPDGLVPGENAAADYQAIRAIYDWCRSSIHYSGTSDKSNRLQAAYDGFTLQSGDCFTYSSVADMLLTRVGYETMEVQRSQTDTFHTWNLVRYQEKWYHFDACPLLAGETFLPFLVNDQDLLDFSESYGKRHPDKSHQHYYQFDSDLYPARGGTSIEQP